MTRLLMAWRRCR